jgi:hypothetical protein
MASRHTRGLFIAGIEVHAQKVGVRVFLSRPTPLAELKEKLALSDDLGTSYVMTTERPDVIDGKATLEWTLGLPDAAGVLAIDSPGRRTWIGAREGCTILGSPRGEPPS